MQKMRNLWFWITGLVIVLITVVLIILSFKKNHPPEKELTLQHQIALNDIFATLDTGFWRNKDKNLQLTNDALRLAQMIDDSNAIAEALFYRARILGNFENNDSNLIYSNQALMIAEKQGNETLLAKIYNNIGNYYFTKDNYYLALFYYTKVETIAERLNIDYLKLLAYNGYGLVYMSLNEYDKAIEYFTKETKLFNNANGLSIRANAIAIINLGEIYLNKKDFSQAENMFKEALAMSQRIGDTAVICDIFIKLGMANQGLRNYSLSYGYLDQASTLALQLKNKRLYGEAIYNLGLLQALQHQPERAKELFEQAMEIFAEVGFISAKQRANLALSDLMKQQGDYMESLQYYQRSVTLSDSILNLKIQKRISDFQWEIEFQKRKYERELLQKKYEAQKIRNLFFIVLIISLILIALLFTKYMRESLKRQKIENDNLQEKIKSAERINELEKIRHQAEIEGKSKELITLSLQLVSKKEILNEIETITARLHKNKSMDEFSFKNLNKIIRNSDHADKDWGQFRSMFEQVHEDFFVKLRQLGSELTENELRLCAYLKIGLTNHEIAKIFNINPGTLKTNRYHIRRKLNLDTGDNLEDFIRGI